MTDRPFVCAVSSVHPIELAAFALANSGPRAGPIPMLQVFYMHDRHKPQNQRAKYLSSHDALPAPFLLIDKQRVIRQLFQPLSDGSLENVGRILSLLNLYEFLLQSEPDDADSDGSNSVVERINLLKLQLQNRSNLETPKKVAEEIINYTIGGLVDSEISVLCYEDYLSSSQGQAACRAALAAIRSEIERNARQLPCAVAFVRGGYIALKFGDNRHELRLGHFDGNRLDIYDEAREICLHIVNASEVNLSIHGSVVLDTFEVELRGPLLQSFLAQIGTLIDAPWYLDNVERIESGERRIVATGLVEAVEAISPVSTSDNTRVSVWAGGQGLRLSPSGYSLIHYRSNSALRLIRALARLPPSIEFDDLEDWRHLLENYPRADQKLLKSQDGINQYLAIKTAENYRRLMTSNLQGFEIFQTADCGIVSLGKRMSELIALIKCTRASQHASTKDAFSQTQPQCTEETFNKMHEAAMRLISASRSWQSTVLSSASLLDRLGRCSDGAPAGWTPSELLVGTEKSDATTKSTGSTNNLDQLEKALRLEATAYYKVVAATCASVLKTHCLNLWLTMARHDFSIAVADLIKRRGNQCTLRLATRLWKISD